MIYSKTRSGPYSWLAFGANKQTKNGVSNDKNDQTRQLIRKPREWTGRPLAMEISTKAALRISNILRPRNFSVQIQLICLGLNTILHLF